MNGYLLDTHIWLWALLSPVRLSPAVRDLLDESSGTLWLSAVSVWEAHMAIERGRLAVTGDPSAWIRGALEAAPVIEAPLTMEVALRSRALRTKLGDPADRFIIATAAVFDLTLVTSDRRIARANECELLVNRRPRH